MRVIIAGSRDGVCRADIDAAMKASGFIPTVVLSGTARGADVLGEAWAADNGIPVERYPADWDKYGRHRAGIIRNAQMAEKAEALVAVWDGSSSGTRNMIQIAQSCKLKVYVHRI